MKFSVRRWRLVAALAVLAGIVAGEAWAHEFKVGLVAPLSGPEAARGRDLRDGFLLAARERDGHAGQESDGHLGRMDVYLLPVDGAGDTDAVLGEVKVVVEGEAVEFLILAVGPGLTAAIGEIAGDAILVDLNGDSVADPAGGQDLASSFERDYRRPITPHAALGHAVAWRIDRAIRAVREDVSNREALRAAFSAAAL